MSAPTASAASFRRIALTGANGFVGRHLAPLLAAAMPAAERLSLQRPGTGAGPDGWPVVEAEIFDRSAVADIVSAFRPDLIVHLAAQASVGEAAGAAEATWRVNFDGSCALASACARFAPEATFLFVSSSEVYGLSFLAGPVDEDTPIRPMNAYARSKAAAEAMIGDVLPAQTRLIVARSFNHIGPGQDERFALPSFAAQIARIEAGLQPPSIKVGNLDAERDFLDVRDVCDAYLALIGAVRELPTRNVFNVASGVGRSLGALLRDLRAQSALPFDIVVDPARLRPSDIASAVGLSERLSARTGWRAARPIEDALAELLRHARQTVGETR
ncbi:MAG: NAD-dependent epimerase/dehydratase family protein [Bradyrhizobium sp.]|nr:MAG: NAD-dependent epimerase/dehydratase family protein [Bradyrhizobium sp.]